MVKVQQRGLGKGLSALISESPAAADTSARTQEKTPAAASAAPAGAPNELPTSSLVPGKYQPRHRFSEEKLEELADSIRKNGIMQPILVRRAERSGNPAYEIIAGERRWRAAGRAGLAHVPVIVRDISDQQALELAIIENVQRADLTPLEEASGYQRLLEEFSYTQEELSQTVGKSRSHIANLLRLLLLPGDIKELLEDGKLTMGHARALLNAEQASDIAKSVVAKGLSVRQTEALARKSVGAEKTSRPRATSPQASATPSAEPSHTGAKDPDIIALEEMLTGNLGMKVDISDQGQGGMLTIHYPSLSELDILLQKLGAVDGGF